MKRVIGCFVIVCLVIVGSLISRVAAESPAPAGASRPPVIEALAGREVRVYFRQEAMPGKPVEWRGGVVKQADDRFVTLSMREGETLFIPMASVAYVESSKAATTRPN